MGIRWANSGSGYGWVGLSKSPPLSFSFRKALTPGPSPNGMKDRDGRYGPYVPPSKNLEAETNIDYRNDRVDWFSFRGFGDGYGSFFGVYVNFICYLILRKFVLFS